MKIKQTMTRIELENLQPGDVIQNASGLAYIVQSNEAGIITATRTLTVTNPAEWTLIEKANDVYAIDFGFVEGESGGGSYEYPPRYDEIKEFAKTLRSVSHSKLSTKFNLRYQESRAIIRALQYDGVISKTWMPGLQGYGVYH